MSNETSSTDPGSTDPGPVRMILRGFARHCPRCGSGRLFRRYFTIVDDCPRCGLHFERESGYWAGALAMNVIIVFAIFAVTFAAMIAATAPDIPVVPLLAVLVPIMAIGPVVFYPISKTLWVAVDRGFLGRLDR